MKVKELFVPKKAEKKKNRSIHSPDGSLPKDEIKSLIHDAYEHGEDYQKILKNIKDEFGPDAMAWARNYMANVLSEK